MTAANIPDPRKGACQSEADLEGVVSGIWFFGFWTLAILHAVVATIYKTLSGDFEWWVHAHDDGS